MKQWLKTIRNNDGFSFIELLAVMFIVNVALITLISMSMQAIQTERFNRNVLIAAQLAQEGIELVRNIRDTDWQAGASPNSVFNPASDGVYAMDYTLSPATALTGGLADANAKLYLDSSGYFSHSSTGSSTKFRRAITIQTNGATSTDVSSEVQFSDGVAARNYKVETTLYDWK
jgi:Tfp pilus assembly protein PilV